MFRHLPLLLLFVAACGEAVPITAPTGVAGGIAGIVADSSGHPILRATVKGLFLVTDGGTRVLSGTSTTDGTGRYNLTFTSALTHDTTVTVVVQAVAAGYAELDVGGVSVHLSRQYPPDTTALTLTMHP